MRVRVPGSPGDGYIDAPDDLPLLVTWDLSNPYSEQAGMNQGCPPGYAMQLRSGGRDGNYKVCRLMTEQYMTDPSIAQRETGLVWQDYIIIVDDAILATIPEVFTVGIPAVAQWTAQLAGETVTAAVSPLVNALPIGWIVIGLIAVAVIWWRPQRP